MSAILGYIAKMILTSGILFLYYHLFLRDKTFHRFNRFYLISSVLLAIVLPLLRFNILPVSISALQYDLLEQVQYNTAVVSQYTAGTWVVAIPAAVVAGLLLVRFLFGMYRMQQLRKRYPQHNLQDVRLYMTDLEQAPFSFFNSLFWRSNIAIGSELGAQILEHEMVHIRQYHTYDKVLLEIVKAVFWFNPFFYFIKRELHLVHEYLADQKLAGHTDTRQFARMLLGSQFSANAMPAINPLRNASVRKRLTMLRAGKTRYEYLRKALVLPLILIIISAFLIHAQQSVLPAAQPVYAGQLPTSEGFASRRDEARQVPAAYITGQRPSAKHRQATGASTAQQPVTQPAQQEKDLIRTTSYNPVQKSSSTHVVTSDIANKLSASGNSQIADTDAIRQVHEAAAIARAAAAQAKQMSLQAQEAARLARDAR
jgi:uncharacterized integral membrane protein